MADLTSMLQAAAGAAVQPSGYQISRSLRFNSADSAYLSRTPASASNRKTWTWSGWVKRSKFGDDEVMFSGGSDPTTVIRFSGEGAASPDGLRVFHYEAGFQFDLTSTAQFRDPSAWYHILVACDTTQATSSNRIKIYVNGVQVTAFDTATYPSLNYDTSINNTVAQNVGRAGAGSNYLNGYLTEINFIDGQALTPSSFGETNATTGVWSPIAYAGSYGTNGFYLNFSDNTSTTTLGEDQAGSNNWTPNNFSVTAGAGNDSLVDVPTRNTEDVDTGAGGEVRGNYATMNPLDQAGGLLFAEGNLKVTADTGWDGSRATFSYPSTGKWYWEALCIARSTGATVGILSTSAVITGDLGAAATGYVYNAGDGNKYNNGSNSAYGATWTTNDLIGIAWDADTGTLSFYKNGVSQGTAYSGLSGTFSPAIGVNGSDSMQANFGNRPFAYTAPSGFKALVTTNLPEPTVVQGDDYFNTVLYTGTGSSLGVTGVGFQPDFTWIKERNGAADHGLYDAVRGVQNQLESNTTTAETAEATGLTAFGTDGFTVGALAQLNTSADTYVAWNWKAGVSNVTNGDGTITSTVRANTTSGFSIVTATSQASGSATFGHGLGVAPSMIIAKVRNTTSDWLTYHKSLGATKYLLLNTTGAEATSNGAFNSTAPTSSVFTMGSFFAASYQFVAYCFAEVEGFSKFGSYTGNGSADGPFVYTGFRPAFVLIKPSSAVDSWQIEDAARSPFNVVNDQLFPNVSDAEQVNAATRQTDFLSNGFKLRGTNAGVNGSGTTYIYMAFAESPFKFALGR